MDEFNDCVLIDDRRMHGGVMRDERHDRGVVNSGLDAGSRGVWKQVFETEQLSGEDAVESGEAEAPFAADEI